MPPASRGTILNCDDYEAGRYAHTRILRQAGFEVKEAASGYETLERVAESPDLVLLDVNLRDISGLEVCRRIKSNPDTAAIPVLHISATAAESANKVLGLESGADGYLVEPVEPNELIATISALIRARRAEAAVRALAREWQKTFETISEGVAVLDRDGRIVRCNPAWAEIVGAAEVEALVGRSFSDLVWGSAAPPNHAPYARMQRSGRSEAGDFRIGERWVHIVVEPMRNDRGDWAGAIHRMSDITVRRQAEAEILRASKLESLGMLAGGIAHDFNNILMAILGNIALAKMALGPEHEMARRLSEAERAALRAKDLTEQLLTYSKGGAPVKRLLDLAALAREAAESGVSGFRVRLVLEPAEDLWPVEADPGQIAHVIRHLVVNACEAMPAGGVVTVSLANCRLGPEHGALPPGPYVRVGVRDEGEGIPPEHQLRVFDPFFTTKPKGTGLGLTTSYWIIKKHGGDIRVVAPGRGTMLELHLPARPGTAGGEASAAAARPTRGCVLFMDDEAQVREVVHQMLEHLGWQVECAADGREAVERYHRALAAGRRFDVVVLDLTVPGGMGGREAVRQLRELDPELRAIVSSGYSNDTVLADYRSHGFFGMVAKPYRLDDLERVLSEAAADRSAPSDTPI
jgi:PAS domain S-box-containing protein